MASHSDDVDEVETTLFDMMEDLSHEKLAIPGLRNGKYILDTRDNAIVREGSNEAYPDDEVYHVVSGAHMNKLIRIMAPYLAEIAPTVKIIEDAYKDAGGSHTYLRIPRNTGNIPFLKVIMEEGYLYVYGYSCRL